jgi:serine/threonine-protein kinase
VIGETVGGYRIVSRLGQGSTGEVFAAQHASVGMKAAIKIIAPALGADPGRLQRYLKEAQQASRINNQGTVKITEVGMPAGYGHGFIVMEQLSGETLAQRIASSGRLSITQIAEVGRMLATVIAALHDDNLVHRDLRPDKIMFVRESGLVQERIKVLVGDALLLGPLHPKGAPYAAPELWRDPASGDWRVDVYAFGCMLFEMATGQKPYSGSGPELGAKHAEYQIPAARSLMPDVPPALDALIARLMGKQIEQRPKSMREISRELDTFAGTARPLAPTKNDTPALVLGEMNAATLDGGTRPVPVASMPASPAATAQMSAHTKSRVPLFIGIALVVVGAIIAVLAMM